MAYTKNVWTNDPAKTSSGLAGPGYEFNAEKMNHLEDGVGTAHDLIAAGGGGGTGGTLPADALSSLATATTGLSRNPGATTSILEVVGKYRISGASADPGRPYLNGIAINLDLPWRTGDPDPTAAGPLPSWVHVTAYLGIGDAVPAWVLAHSNASVVQEVTGTTTTTPTTFTAKWNGVGLADETAVAAATAGTGDTAITGLFSAAAPVVEATGVPTWYPTGGRMVRFPAAATTPAFYFLLTAGTTRRIRWHLRTPATWPGSFPIMAVKNGTGTGSDATRVVIGSTTAPGRVQVMNSAVTQAALSTGNGVLATSSDYYMELALTQNATAVNGTASLTISDSNGGQLYDSGTFSDDTNAIGFGTTHDRVYFGTVSSITTTFYEGRFAIRDDATTAIGTGG